MKYFTGKTVLAVLIGIVLIMAVIYPSYTEATDKTMGEKLVRTMYDFEPTKMIEQNDQLRALLKEDIVDVYLLSNDTRQLNVYLRFEMKPAKARILSQTGKSVIFTIDGEVMGEENQMFQIDFTYQWGKITSIREFALFPIPPTGIWDYQ